MAAIFGGFEAEFSGLVIFHCPEKQKAHGPFHRSMGLGLCYQKAEEPSKIGRAEDTQA
jgi:hypothetical protein